MVHSSDPDLVREKDDIELKHIEKLDNDDSLAKEQAVTFETDEHALPPGYFRSSFFVGTMAAIGLGLFAGTAGFKFAGPVLTVINAEIGPVRRVFISPKGPHDLTSSTGSQLCLDRPGIHSGKCHYLAHHWSRV